MQSNPTTKSIETEEKCKKFRIYISCVCNQYKTQTYMRHHSTSSKMFQKVLESIVSGCAASLHSMKLSSVSKSHNKNLCFDSSWIGGSSQEAIVFAHD